MLKRFFITIIMLLSAVDAFSAISFTNGYWSTTFDCADWTQNSPTQWTQPGCDGVEYTDDSAYFASAKSQINADGNHAAGGGGKGWRTYYDGGTHNGMTTPARIVFPDAVTEFWVRFYYRIPSGQYMDNPPAHKIIYLLGNTNFRVDWPVDNSAIQIEGDVNQMYLAADTAYSNVDDGGNWVSLYGGEPWVAQADGEWHCFEFYFNVGTTSSNGIFRFWLDGKNIINHTSLNMEGGAGGSFTSIDIPHNHDSFMSNSDLPNDVDDIAIATSSYAGFVTNSTGFATGLTMIGPISAAPEEADPPTKGALLFSESFENTSWAARGWWDDGASGNEVVNSGGQSGNALTLAFAEEADTPTGWQTMRNRLSSSASEFLIEYYIKFATGWRGSGEDWHPHIIHMMSTADGDYAGMSSANSDIYFEVSTGTSSPYAISPRTGHQDELRVNTSNGAVPNNLVSTTETRSANHCNTPYTLSDATAYDCYSHSGNYYSANWWVSPTVTIPANTWTKITAHVKRNTWTNGVGNFDGIMRVWVGDDLAIESDQVLYAAGAYQSTAWDKVVLAPYIGSGSPISQTMYLDELAVFAVGSGSASSIGSPSGSFTIH